MSNITLDLNEYELFEEKSLVTDKRLTFIYGKNGTGKSTLASIIKSQEKNYNVHIFQGFLGVVDEEQKLNTVVLGVENVDINRQIREIQESISLLEKEIQNIENETTKQKDNSVNLWEKVNDKKEELNKQEVSIKEFCINSASRIKNYYLKVISQKQYNLNDFLKEIPEAKQLTEQEVQDAKSTLSSKVKNAEMLDSIDINLESCLKELNQILSHKVDEQEILVEMVGDNNKIKFADNGLNCHKPNDKCAFCGGLVTSERYQKLQKFFSVEDINILKNKIDIFLKKIETHKKK